MATPCCARLFSTPTKLLRPSRRCLFQYVPGSRRQESSYQPPFPAGVINSADRPRWDHTPELMRAPIRHRPGRDPRLIWKVNENPAKLDWMYKRLLGPGGDEMLTEEVKWLAVTHKSFDQGRRGYNDRLAFMGRRVLSFQTALVLLTSSAAQQHHADIPPDPYGREPFRHWALEGVDILTQQSVQETLHPRRLYVIANDCGLTNVVRWLPKDLGNLPYSGILTVVNEALFAVLGAVALQQGGVAAARIARERILYPMNVR